MMNDTGGFGNRIGQASDDYIVFDANLRIEEIWNDFHVAFQVTNLLIRKFVTQTIRSIQLGSIAALSDKVAASRFQWDWTFDLGLSVASYDPPIYNPN